MACIKKRSTRTGKHEWLQNDKGGRKGGGRARARARARAMALCARAKRSIESLSLDRPRAPHCTGGPHPHCKLRSARRVASRRGWQLSRPVCMQAASAIHPTHPPSSTLPRMRIIPSKFASTNCHQKFGQNWVKIALKMCQKLPSSADVKLKGWISGRKGFWRVTGCMLERV